jgi:hypothetical protein
MSAILRKLAAEEARNRGGGTERLARERMLGKMIKKMMQDKRRRQDPYPGPSECSNEARAAANLVPLPALVMPLAAVLPRPCARSAAGTVLRSPARGLASEPIYTSGPPSSNADSATPPAGGFRDHHHQPQRNLPAHASAS